MKNLLAIIIIFMTFVFVFINPKSSSSMTLNTNIEDLVIKNFQHCIYGKSVTGTLVNRSNRFRWGNLEFKYFDSDNDPIGSCTTRVMIDGNEGKSVSAYGCNCANATSVLAEFSPRKSRININPVTYTNEELNEMYARDKQKQKSFIEKFFDLFK